MKEYHKIYSPFKRATSGPNKNKFIIGQWAQPEFEYLADSLWLFTEKVDGTNIRIHWDGHGVTFGGRTDNAQIPAKLVQHLKETFPEELFEQAFGADPVTLYGEGYGAGIQSGGNYRQDQSFVLFDVRIGDWWLRRADVEDVARKLGVDVVPQMGVITLREAILRIQSGTVLSRWGNFRAEGFVGTPVVPLFNRAGERIIVKIKYKDFL